MKIIIISRKVEAIRLCYTPQVGCHSVEYGPRWKRVVESSMEMDIGEVNRPISGGAG